MHSLAVLEFLRVIAEYIDGSNTIANEVIKNIDCLSDDESTT